MSEPIQNESATSGSESTQASTRENSLSGNESSQSSVDSAKVEQSKSRSVVFSAFEHNDYRKLFLANSAIFFGISGKILVISLLAVRFVDTAYPIAKINFSLALPMCLGSMIAGAMVDRVERRRLMLLGLLVMISAEAFVCLQLFLGLLQFWQLAIATIVAGSAFPFIMPASTSMMYQLLGYHRVGSGMAMISGVMSLSRVVSPWLTAILIQYVGFRGAYLAFVILFMLAFLCMWLLPGSQPSANQRMPLHEDILNGFRYLGHTPQVLVCLIYGMLPMLVAMTAQYFMVIFANDVWKVGEQGVGTMMGAMGIGGILGALLAGRLQSGSGRLKMMMVAAFACGIAFALFGQSPYFYLALIFLVIANCGAIACQTIGNVCMQLLVDDKIRGRVTSFTLMSFGLTPFIAFPVEMGVNNFGAPSTFLGAGLMLVGLLILFYLGSSTLRKLDTYIAESFRAQKLKSENQKNIH